MKLLLILSFQFIVLSAFGQWECRSNLAGHLTPFSEDGKLQWAAEINSSGGALGHDLISNAMAFYGLDYSAKNYQIYIEAGLKAWYMYDHSVGLSFSRAMPGLRELSYNYYTPSLEVNLGFQAMKMPDYIMLNERALGANIEKKIGGLGLQLNGGTVTKQFARNGIFCANCYLYDIVPSRNQRLGGLLGDTNFASLSFSKKVGERVTKDESKSDSEFEAFDDFESFASLENKSEASLLSLNSYGGFLYSEFGNYYNEPELYLGLYAEFSLGELASFKTEGIYQGVTNNNAVLFYLQAEKTIDYTSNMATTLQASYLGKANIDHEAIAMPRFSNLMMGEVLRMDMIDLPLFNASAKHQFLDHQLSLKLQYTKQFKAQEMQELNFSVGKFFFDRHLRSTLITGIAKSNELDNNAMLAKLELRVFF